MISFSLSAHLWQSTYCVAAAWLLTLALRRNRAAVRYWIWLAASVKFLIPFSLLVTLGTQVASRLTATFASYAPAPEIRQQVSYVMEAVAQPLNIVEPPASQIPLAAPTAPAHPWLPAILAGIWICGILIGIVYWLRWCHQIGATRRRATPLHLGLPITVRTAPGRLEPGVLGIWRPVLLLPEGITGRLTPQQLDAVIAHELCHVRRRDNLTAAIHMVVETIFWFHPLVWWIRTRLVEERERACDEDVLRSGSAPMAYAEGILEVCKYYVESPRVCMAGISGANLKKRIDSIMENTLMSSLSLSRKLLIACTALLLLAAPIAIGIFSAPPSHAQPVTPAAPSAVIAPPVAAAPQPKLIQPKPIQPKLIAQAAPPHPAMIVCDMAAPCVAQPATLAPAPQFANVSLALDETPWTRENQPHAKVNLETADFHLIGMAAMIQKAYPGVAYYQIQWPSWMTTPGEAPWRVGPANAFYDLSATLPPGTKLDQLPVMFQALLASRFKMTSHWETQNLQVYALAVSSGGIKFGKSTGSLPPLGVHAWMSADGYGWGRRGPMNPEIAGMTMDQLSSIGWRLDLPLVNMTGLDGVYDIDLTVAREPGHWPLMNIPAAPTQAARNLNEGWSNDAFIKALETQLGLTVEKRIVPVKVLVIDHVERIPTAE